MLLPLLGACAVVGRFQGPEWEPVRSLLSQDQSCRDPRCYGNLLVLCLFLIWQVQRSWCQFTRTYSSKRNAIKVPSQKCAAPSTNCETSFLVIPKFLFTPGKIRNLDVHVQQWTPRQRWGYERNLLQPWTQCLRSPQNSHQDLPCVHNPSEAIFCSSSFSSSCLFPQDSSWETWKVPWNLRNSQAHSSLDTCQRMEQLLVPSQETMVPEKPAVSMKNRPTSLPNLPSAQRLKFCVREFLPDPLNRQMRISTWKSWGSPQKPWAPWSETQTMDRECREVGQALQYISQRESRSEDAWEIQESGDQVPVNLGMEDDAEAKALGGRNQILGIHETDGEMPTPAAENRDQLGVEKRAQTENPWKETQREAEENPSSQAHAGENKGGLRSKTDTATQTAEWGSQDESESRTAVEKSEKEARGEEEGKVQAQALGTQGWTGGGNNESMILEEQIGGEGDVQTLMSGRENLGAAIQQDSEEAQALEWEKQRYIRNENESQPPALGKERQSGSVQAGKTQASKRGNPKLSRPAVQVGWDNGSLGRGKGAREPQMPRLKQLREIREEDWVVIKASWWGSQRLVLSEMNREFNIACWGNENQVRGDYTAEIQAPEENEQRNDGDKHVPHAFILEAEHLRGKAGMGTYSAERESNEQIEEEDGTDIQTFGKRNIAGFVKDEDDAMTRELGKEKQGLLGNEFLEKIHIPKWRDQEHFRDNDYENTRAPEAESGSELRSYVAGEICAAREESKSQLRSALGVKTHLSEWKNQEQMGGEDRTEVQALQKRYQKELGDEDDANAWTPERETQGRLEREIGGSSSPRRGCWKQTGGENAAENQAPERSDWRVAGCDDAREIWRLRRKKQKLLSRVNRKTHYSSEWKNQLHFGSGNGAEIHTQRKRTPRRPAGSDGLKTLASVTDDLGQSRGKTDEEIQTQVPEIQIKGGNEAAAGIQDEGSQRKCRAKVAEQSRAPKRGDKGLGQGKDPTMASFQGDFSGGKGLTGRKHSLAQPPGLPLLEHKQTVAVTGVDSSLCPERKPHVHWDEVFQLDGREEGHLISQGTAPSRKHRADVHPTSQQPKGSALKKSKHLLLESLMKRRIAHLRWGLPRRILESYLVFHFLEPCSVPQAGVRLSKLCTDQELQRQQERHCESQSSLLGLKSSESVPALERNRSKLPIQARPLEKSKPHRSAEPKDSSIPPKMPRRSRPPEGVREPQIPAAGNPRPASKSRSWCGPERVQEPSSENSRDRRMTRSGVSPMAEAGRASIRVRASTSTAGHRYLEKECTPWETPEPCKCRYQQSIDWSSGSREPQEDTLPWKEFSSCSTQTSSFRGRVHSAVARLSMTVVGKMTQSPQLAKTQRSAPNLSLPHPRENNVRVCTALERDLQSLGHPCAGTSLPRTKSHQGQEAPGLPNRFPRNPPALQKFGFMKHLRCFLRQRGFKK